MILHLILVAIQFGGIAFFVVTGTVYPQTHAVLLLEIVAVALGAWAIVAMKLHTLTILPSVRQGGQLCTTGPYRVVRHPMYTAVLLLLSAFLINTYSHTGLAVLLLVLADLLLKMKVEEKILIAHYPEYAGYMKNTKRLIPFLY